VSYPANPVIAGGDDPMFVQNMVSWFGSHDVAFEDYFNSDNAATATVDAISTRDGQFPNASALYQKLSSASP
jgi:hypothetical protein